MAPGPALSLSPCSLPPGTRLCLAKAKAPAPDATCSPGTLAHCFPACFPSSLGASQDGLRVEHPLDSLGGHPRVIPTCALHSRSSSGGSGCSPLTARERGSWRLGGDMGLQEPLALLCLQRSPARWGGSCSTVGVRERHGAGGASPWLGNTSSEAKAGNGQRAP